MSDDTLIYLDHNATTPVRPEVIDAMLPFMTLRYGNASSVHRFGREAKKALEESRERIAGLIGADPEEIYFTGCGTESDNIALSGTLLKAPSGKNGLVTTAVEHSAILKTAARLESIGIPVAYVGVDSRCRVDMDELKAAAIGSTALVSIMHANNETGVLQVIERAAVIAHDAGALFHTDAVQSAGKIPIDVRRMGIDMLSMSAHKLNALKGVGTLYVRKGIILAPVTYGGGHERGLRPGTENVPGIVGFAKAFELAAAERAETGVRLRAMRDRLEDAVRRDIPDVLFNGMGTERLPGTSNISFAGVDGEALLFAMDNEGIAVSTGSACTSGEVEPSHVLVAMGVSPQMAQSSIRFSLGWGTTDNDIDHVASVLPSIVERLRRISAGVERSGC